MKGLALITGASSGIGLELARCAAKDGYDLLIAADRPEIMPAAEMLRNYGVQVDAVELDLSTVEGVDALLAKAGSRPIDLLLANAGHGLGHAFLDQDFRAIRHMIDTNVTGTVYLIHRVGQDMRAASSGRILIVGSIAGVMAGAYAAVYNATKAFIDSFSLAIREELKDSSVTVTCLMPGSTDTDFFERANMLDTKLGQGPKDTAEFVAKIGYAAMMEGEADVIAGWRNKLQSMMAHLLPGQTVAHLHASEAKPGTAPEPPKSE